MKDLTDEELYDRLRAEVIGRYARLNSDGTVVLCAPTRQEWEESRLTGTRPRSERKVTYDTVEAALEAAKELHALGAQHTEPYTCHRSTRRHHQHLCRPVVPVCDPPLSARTRQS